MELHEIRYYLAVCQTLNFTKAAELCSVSQPALTRAIQKMEADLGGLLFSRERGNTHLTELGRLMQPHLEEVMARSQAARDQARRFLQLESAQLRVGIMCSIGPLRFGDFLKQFREAHPGIELILTEAVPERLTEALRLGELDVALIAQPTNGGDRIRYEALYSERFVVACAESHPFASRDAIAMREMDGQTYLQRINCEFGEALNEHCRTIGAQLVQSYRSEREDWIQTMVAAGMGVCFLPEFSATHPGVVARPVQEPEVRRDVCVATVPGRRWSLPMARFVRAIRRHRWAEAPAALAPGLVGA